MSSRDGQITCDRSVYPDCDIVLLYGHHKLKERFEISFGYQNLVSTVNHDDQRYIKPVSELF